MAQSQDLSNLLGQIHTLGQSQLADRSNRDALRDATKKLLQELEDPEDVAQRFVFQPLAHACMCAAWRGGILQEWPKARMDTAEIASMSGCDQRLVVRLMRALTTYGVFSEVDEGVYEHNKLSMTISTPPFSRSALPMASRILPGISKLPDYLESISFRNPGDDVSDKTLFSYTNNTDLNFFQWMQERPAVLAAFNKSMAASIASERAATEKGFADIYPFEAELGAAVNSTDDVVMVDVGGGYGHVLEDIRLHLPSLKGRMVLEDIPETVEKAIPLENVEVIPYNFFTTPQPVIGARAYLLRHILDDWSDDSCRTILRNTIPAMVRDKKSRLLLVEVVLEPKDARLFGAMMDINMMRYSGMNRTEKQWAELLRSVGLTIKKIWPPVRHDSVIEAVPSEWV